MKYTLNPAVAICVGVAMTCVIGCAPTSQVTRTTTARQFTTTNPVVDANTTTTTQYNNGTVQRTYTQPAPDLSQDQSTTIVTSAGDDGSAQRRTTTTYASPY